MRTSLLFEIIHLMQINKKLNFNNFTKGAAVVFIAITIFIIGNYTGGRSVVLGQSAEFTVMPNPPEGISAEEFAPFWKAWKILENKYVDQSSSTPKKRLYGAIKGLTASYGDPYTTFFDPVEAKAFEGDISGNFEGVGMELGLKDNTLTVVSPFKDNPAYKAGMRAGDKILAIDGVSTNGITIEKAVKSIRGPKGTVVKLTVGREGEKEPLVIEITRGVINMPTIETEVHKSNGVVSKIDSSSTNDQKYFNDGIYTIKLFSFNGNSPEMFRQAIKDFKKSGSHKLILDLRGNPGGYLDAAVYMASYFLPAGSVVVTEDFGQDKRPRVYRSEGFDIFDKSLKMIILVDGGSASASEILAGALRENDKAKLLGTTTFGKGSVQELIQLTPDTTLKVTVARWLTPNGHNLSKQGLTPDYEVKITADDIVNKRDPQLDRAVEILRKEF